MARIVPLIAAALGALLLWSAYPPMGETCAIVFALAPLLAVSRLCTPKKALGTWFLGGFLFWFGTLAWMPAISKNNGPLPLVVLGWIGLAALCASYFALFGWLSARAWTRVRALGRPWAKLLALVVLEPALWAGCEWLRGWLFTGFPWNFLGTAVGAAPSLASPACLGGVYLVGACVVLLNGVFATLACRIAAQMRREEETGPRWARMLETALPLALILACFMAGSAVQANVTARRGVPVRVALVQRNAPCVFSKRDRRQDPYETFGRLLETAAVARPDLVVWAESAMAEFGSLGSDGAHHAALFFARQTGGASLLAGGDWCYDVETAQGTARRVQNGAGLYVPTATNVTLQVYGKQHLVPFGEYIPFDKWITPLQKLSPVGVSLWPGEPKVLTLPLNRELAHPGTPAPAHPDTPAIRIAPLICFEDTDPVLARKAAKLGAQAIVLITNDSWFSHSNETVQHAAQAVLRAIETGLPVVRTGNSGVTGIVSATGRTRWLEDGNGKPLVDAEGTMVDTVAVPESPVLTPYSRVGDLPLAALFALALAFALWPRKVRG